MVKDDSEKEKPASKQKSSKSKKSSLDNTAIQIKKAEEYMKKISDQLTNRLDRIDKIKRSH